MPPLFGQADLPFGQRPADVPLLRLLPALPPACPDCGGKLNFIGVGTQKVQEELETLFPGTPVLRMDTDTVTAARSHEAILEEFRRGRRPSWWGPRWWQKDWTLKM